ncbi:MAG: N-acetylmuramoyl-L-alanine amidase [Chloroflexaceae bacterium]|nr:N-acetylmuramoyl-L-alanine amidase [Chloroflexaceae bacterium]
MVQHDRPRGILLHQLDVPIGMTDTLPFLRALTAYQTDVLGWDDLAYHYIIDETGMLYEGRLGGPTSTVTRLAGGGTAVHIALIGNLEQPPTEAAQETLVQLLAWLGQAYNIPPTGSHTIVLDEQLLPRDNIANHNDVAVEAPDPGEPMRSLLPSFRSRADEATVRSRWYFAEGNVAAYNQRVALFNPGQQAATVRILLQPGDATGPFTKTVALPAATRSDVLFNTLLTGTTSLPSVIEASTPIIVERVLEVPSDASANPGITELSRVWYFAEGSTADTFQTYLALFNPHDTPVEATVTYMKGDGIQAEQQVGLPPGQRVVITVRDVLPDVGFGARVVANQPIAAERTMRFGSDLTGLHTSAGIGQLSRRWYFAEGTTEDPFQMRLLLLNPNRQPANATVNFMTPDGTSLTRRYIIPPTTRLVIDVNEVVPTLGVATEIETDRPIAAERALYFIPEGDQLPEPDPGSVLTDTATLPPASNIPLVGTASPGMITPAFTWHFAEGRTINGLQFLLLGNPSPNQALVQVDFFLFDGSVQTQELVMPARSRYTIAVHDIYPGQATVATTVRSTQPIVAERSLFPRGAERNGITTTPGVPGD